MEAPAKLGRYPGNHALRDHPGNRANRYFPGIAMISTDFPIGSKVHVTERNGTRVYNFLIVATPERLEFESGSGWVDVRDLSIRGWIIVEGWLEARVSIPTMGLP